MGDRAPVHITIGGALRRDLLGDLAACAEEYDLRTEWDGEPFGPAAVTEGESLELYGTELNGGQVTEVDAFCIEHGLIFRRWSGGCPGAYLPEIVVFDGTGPMRDYTASEDEYVLFPPSWIRGFTRLRDLKRAMAKAEITVPPLVIISRRRLLRGRSRLRRAGGRWMVVRHRRTRPPTPGLPYRSCCSAARGARQSAARPGPARPLPP